MNGSYDRDSGSSWFRRHKAVIGWSSLGGLIAITLFTLWLNTYRGQVEAGHEAVVVDKPFWTTFSDGGVRSEPMVSGAQWFFWTTTLVPYDMRYVQKQETFDDVKDGTITADNIPIDFNAYIKIRPVAGKTPKLHEKFGPNWYAQNIQQVFRTAVRDEVAQKSMTALTTRQVDVAAKTDVLGDIQRRVLAEMRTFAQGKGMDIEIDEVLVGKATPPQAILDELAKTGAEEQREKSEVKRARAEAARQDAETKRALADNAYRSSMGLNQGQFIQLELAKVQLAAVKACAEAKGTCTALIGDLGVQPALPLK